MSDGIRMTLKKDTDAFTFAIVENLQELNIILFIIDKINCNITSIY